MTSNTLHPYKKPKLLAIFGAGVPLIAGIAAAINSYRPQCPDNYTQAQVDKSHCIVGADMSAVGIFFAIPIALLFVATALIWAGVIWYRIHKSLRP